MFIDIFSHIYSIYLDNKCYPYICSVFIHVFIESFVFIGISWSLLWFMSVLKWSVSIQFVFLLYLLDLSLLLLLFYLFMCTELDLIFLLFNTCIIKFIEGKFYFEGRACYIGKIMPTCIE